MNPEEVAAAIASYRGGVPPGAEAAARDTFVELRHLLDRGAVRAAERDQDGRWHVNEWVKAGILLGFRVGAIVDFTGAGPLSFLDKDTLPPKRLTPANKVRVVPGGSAMRAGAFVAPGVICMPPMFVNIGAYVDEGTLIDSHALVGSCAQIGKRVHLSAGAQIGGVLEPVGALPVIIEDDVLVGGNCGVYEGAIVRAGAVLAAGTILTGSTPVFDLVHDRVYRRTGDAPLEVPPNAVVVPGTRPVSTETGRRHGLSLYAPVVVKYRDGRTNASVAIEHLLRG